MEGLKQTTDEESARLKNEAASLYHELIQKPEIAEALTLLDGLPEHLRYHDKAHTLDVITETILFALADGASREVTEQQAISAAWHDVGYIEQDKENEPIAIHLFEQSAAYKTLPDSERKEVIANILDTALVMKGEIPYLLQQQSKFGYALDGDVSNFGRNDFFEKRMKVAEEMGLDLTNPDIKKKFYKFTLDLLKNHEWKTASARMLRQLKKEENIRGAEEEYTRISNVI
jgi:hypothetical protein